MHHVNDDMDEIFRRAGKEYPLDTGGGDWEKIAAELNIPKQEGSGGRHKKFLWLLILIPFSFLCTYYFVDKDRSSVAAVDQGVSTGVTPEKKNHELQGASEEATGTDPRKSGNRGALSKEFYNGSEAVAPDKAALTGKPNAIDKTNKKDLPLPQDRLASELAGSSYIGKDDPASPERKGQPFGLSSRPYPSPRLSPLLAEQRIIAPMSLSKNRGQGNEKTKRFYAALMGGADATTIKFQKIENAGYDLGLLLGYSFGKKWSIETGLFHDKKFYYSEGEYFNTSKIYIPPDTRISSVEGNCSMWEIPLSVRYNLKTAARHSWFVTGGVSSYLMKKEDYSYGYYYLTTGQTHYYDRSYDHSSKTLFSVAQISGGYTHRLGKLADLRIEPYFKIPLRGVGIGSMPFQSAGIHIGLTKSIF